MQISLSPPENWQSSCGNNARPCSLPGSFCGFHSSGDKTVNQTIVGWEIMEWGGQRVMSHCLLIVMSLHPGLWHDSWPMTMIVSWLSSLFYLWFVIICQVGYTVLFLTAQTTCENGRKTDRSDAYCLPEIHRKVDQLYHSFVCVFI